MACRDKLCWLGYSRVELSLVFNEKVVSENIVGLIKIIFGKSLLQLAWLLLKRLIEISHIASVKSVLISIVAFKMLCRDKACCLDYNRVDT